jgi:transcriptional regulator with XRE-family HTH domain
MGAVIRSLRARRKLTQETLAKRAKVSQGYLAKLEAGQSGNPSLAVVRRLARALKVTVADLLE